MLFFQTLRMFILWKGCLSKLWECLCYEKVVCPNFENVYSAKSFFVQTLRVFAFWKCCLSKLWECSFREKAFWRNSENVYSLKSFVVKTPICLLCEKAVKTLRMFALWKGCLSKLWECLFSESWQVGKSIANYFRYTVSRVADRGRGWYVQLQGGVYKCNIKKSFLSPLPLPSTPAHCCAIFLCCLGGEIDYLTRPKNLIRRLTNLDPSPSRLSLCHLLAHPPSLSCL